MSGILYIVATPIGNLSDMSKRAIDTLNSVDFIGAEDTRNTGVLLNHFGIHTPMRAYHKFNENQIVNSFIEELLSGKNIAIVSDAGTPCINDPGFVICEAAANAGITIISVPGPSAVVTAIAASGLPSSSFTFLGFFPREKKDARDIFDYMKNNREELYIFYESPLRIKDTIKLMSEEIGSARLVLCNDLTKLHERIYRGNPSEVYNELDANPNATKGEYCLLVHYKPAVTANEAVTLSAEAHIVDLMVKEQLTSKDAIKKLSLDKSVPYSKNELYQASLNLKTLI